MRNRGVSLIELMIVVATIGILAVALGFSFVGWQGAYKLERATKDLYTDLMSARSLALTQDRMLFATLIDTNNYSMIADTNDSKNPNVGDIPLPTYPKRTDYELNWAGAVPVNQSIGFDRRGTIRVFIPPLNVLVVDPYPLAGFFISFTTAADVDPDYNCIVISQTRIKMGKMVGGNCNEK